MRVELVNGGIIHGDESLLSNVNVSFKGGDLSLGAGMESSGKSALFDLLSLNRGPDRGNIFIDGKDPFTDSQIMREYLEMMGIVPEPGTYPLDCTLDGLIVANKQILRSLPLKEYLKRIEEGKKLFNLTHEGKEKMGDLSRSERVRFLLVLEVVRNPSILILDSVLSEAGELWGERIFLFCRKICGEDRIVILLERVVPEYLEDRQPISIEDSGPFRFYTYYRKYEAAI
jgi:ABC-2 type transport system ATP-binding protein